MSFKAPVLQVGRLEIPFTALLYAAVIDATLHHFRHLGMTQENILRGLALLFVVIDFYFYYRDMNRVRVNPQQEQVAYLGVFSLDIVVLGTWFMLALAAEEEIPTFLGYLTLFLFSVALWELLAPIGRRPKRWLQCPIAIVAFLFWLGAKGSYFIPSEAYLGVIVVLYIVWRIIYYFITEERQEAA